MTVYETLLVFGWLAMVVAGLIFQILYGLPWRAPRHLRPMTWQLALGNLVIWLESGSFLLLGVSLLPAVIVLYVSVGIMIWKISTLARARPGPSSSPAEEEPDGT